MKQDVYLNGQTSNFLTVQHEVPQGPLLSITYVNDIVDCLHPNVSSLFADETTLLNFHKYIDILEHSSNLSVIKTGEWLTTSKLNINYLVIASNMVPQIC